MKNILLPTDLTVQSLWPIHNIVEEAGNERVTIHVVHLLSLPSSIGDLLTLKQPYADIPANFSEALQLLRNRYQGILEKISFEFLYSNTARYLNNVIEARKINVVYMLDNYKYKQPLSSSEKCELHFNKCKVPVVKLPLHSEAFSEYQILSSLLNSNQKEATVAAKATSKVAVSYS